VEPEVAATLEDWGLDAEAALAWGRLTGRARRRLRRRRLPSATWADAVAAAGRDDVQLLAAVRAVVARDDDETVALLGDWPPEWIGAPIDVRDAPTRRGPVSCSVRWHDARPALLWDGPADTTFTAPGLDPTWSSREPRGEALLAEFRRPSAGG